MPIKKRIRPFLSSISFMTNESRGISRGKVIRHSLYSTKYFSFQNSRRALSLSLCFSLIIVSLLSIPRPINACAPAALSAIFTFTRHPDLPFDRYARGDIGVLQSTYPRAYLFAAYRYLNGINLNAAEQQAVVSLWNERLEYKPFDLQTESWSAPWLEARKVVPDAPKVETIDVYRAVDRKDEYINFINCTSDSFQFAAKRLQKVAAKYGAASDRTKSWLTAQDEVFGNCHDGQNQIEAPPANTDQTLIAERMYQAASALFYAMRFDEARKVFELIARDAQSPYQREAEYLIARTFIRQATLAPASDKQTRDAAFAQAENHLRQVLNDPRAAAYHKSARGLLNYVRLRANTEERLHELARSILARNSDTTLYQDLADYTYAMDSLLGKFDGSEQRKLADAPSTVRADEVSDWIVTFQATDREAMAHAISKWQQTNQTTWLVSAISKANKSDSQTPLLLAADKIPASSPAYAAVNFHAIRLLIALGSADEARRRIDVILNEQRAALPPSAVNLFLSERMPLARNLEEFLRDAQRAPVAYSSDIDGREVPDDVKEADIVKQYANGGRAYFDVDGANVLNSRLPLSTLREAATSQILTTGLRRDVTQATFVRAVLLENRQLASELAPQVARLMPELKTSMQTYLSSASDDEAKYNALYMLLKFPGLEPYIDVNLGRSTPTAEIDNFRDNWWCDEALTARRVNLSPQNDLEQEKARLARAPAPLFLNAEQTQQARKELAQLAALGTAPNYLCLQAIEWAKAHPDDARVPEALHLAVKATRYGCTDEKTGTFSKAAFDVLHKQYPNSEWAKQTKYWYK